MNRSIGPDPVDLLVNGQHSLTFLILCIFSSRDPPIAIFSWNPQFFMPNAKRILIFGKKLTIYLSMSIWCIWCEIHAIRRYIYQEFIKKSLDHKEITPCCLLISTNFSSLRGFVKISASWSFVFTNSSVMWPFCTWSLRKWCLISMYFVLECYTGFFEMFMALVLSHFIGTC